MFLHFRQTIIRFVGDAGMSNTLLPIVVTFYYKRCEQLESFLYSNTINIAISKDFNSLSTRHKKRPLSGNRYTISLVYLSWTIEIPVDATSNDGEFQISRIFSLNFGRGNKILRNFGISKFEIWWVSVQSQIHTLEVPLAITEQVWHGRNQNLPSFDLGNDAIWYQEIITTLPTLPMMCVWKALTIGFGVTRQFFQVLQTPSGEKVSLPANYSDYRTIANYNKL